MFEERNIRMPFYESLLSNKREFCIEYEFLVQNCKITFQLKYDFGNKIFVEQLKKEIYRVIDEYPPLNWEYESSCIYHPYPLPEEIFSHLDKRSSYREMHL